MLVSIKTIHNFNAYRILNTAIFCRNRKVIEIEELGLHIENMYVESTYTIQLYHIKFGLFVS